MILWKKYYKLHEYKEFCPMEITDLACFDPIFVPGRYHLQYNHHEQKRHLRMLLAIMPLPKKTVCKFAY